MKRLLAGLVLCAAAGASGAPRPEPKADLLLRGGAIYTVDAARSWADALAVTSGRIVYVGPAAGSERYIGPKTQVLDLNGKLVLPGLRDSHAHPLEGGLALLVCDLSDATTQAQLVAAKLPVPTRAEQAEGLKRALDRATSLGLVGLQDANVGDEALAAYAEADRKGTLNVRLGANLSTQPALGEAQVDALVRKRAAHQGGRRLAVRSAKIFADGVIESHTAALLEPYLDRPAELGLPNYEPEVLARFVTRLDQAGFQVHIHAIGDRAIRMSLDAFEAAQRANGRRDARHQLAHIQLIDPADIPRFRSLGVSADFQALWAYADTYITDLTEPQLGPARSRWLYPIASVARTGAVLVGGSDWSVSSLNPLDAIEVAVTRRALGETEKPSWIPEERVDLATMLAAYTINGAYLAGEERVSGSLEVGKSADLIVLDKDLFTLPAHQIHSAKVLLTLLEGQETFRAPTFAATAPAAAP